MITDTRTADRVPLEDMREIITRALAGGDYEHDAEWHRPPECPCHDHGLERCTQYAGILGSCQGYAIEVDTPEPHKVTAEILTAGLAPDQDGMVGTEEAARSILRVIGEKLAPFPYTLRAHSLVRRLTAVSGEYELAHGLADTGVPEDASSSGYSLRCMVCTKELPTGCKRSRRTCSDACRQALRRMRAAASRQGPVTVTL